MLCAKLGHWPFVQPPHQATIAQNNLLTAAWLSLQPKPQKGNRSPHGKLDKRTMAQWRERVKRERENA